MFVAQTRYGATMLKGHRPIWKIAKVDSTRLVTFWVSELPKPLFVSFSFP